MVLWKYRYYGLGLLAILYSLWVSANALRQTQEIIPGETAGQVLRALLLGRPVAQREICSPEVHANHTAIGPDGKLYPTWHPPVDMKAKCYFDHEHGSDPRTYLGYPSSGMPVFGFTAHQASIEETHAGYKVFVTNDDTFNRAWMIVLHQDTASPQRLMEQFHTLDWHISRPDGEKLVEVHLLADFGAAAANCGERQVIPFSLENLVETERNGQKRVMPTTGCASHNVYEAWDGFVTAAGVFTATPTFGVNNPISVVDPADPGVAYPMCAYRPADEGCQPLNNPWRGNRRSVLHPEQVVHNTGLVEFYTDAYGQPVDPSAAGAIRQYVTNQGWDDRQAGAGAFFRIQTYSRGVFTANPPGTSGFAEFTYGLPAFP